MKIVVSLFIFRALVISEAVLTVVHVNMHDREPMNNKDLSLLIFQMNPLKVKSYTASKRCSSRIRNKINVFFLTDGNDIFDVRSIFDLEGVSTY